MKKITLCLLFPVLALSGCGSRAGKPAVGRAEVTVGVMTVREVQAPDTYTYVGQVRAGKSAVLTSRYGGTLVSLDAEIGRKVSQGQVLAEIDSKNIRSTYDMAAAALRQAEDGYARVSKVHGAGGIPEVKMVEIETQLSKARAAFDAASQALEDCRVKAPFDGTISEVYVDSGVEVMTSSPLLKLVDVSGLEVVVPVPESEVGKISAGDMAFMDVPAVGASDVPVSVSSKGVTASALSHSYDCVFRIGSRVTGLMPGMVCKVSLRDGNAKAIVIPASAVRTDAEGRYVWTVGDGGIVAKRHVVPGGFSGDGTVIMSGLSEGDVLIVSGVSKVSGGMKVNASEK